MLIDATHPEETRVVVTRGSRVEEFDYESATRKQLRGNIYLAKIARIEPSLQAAFVNYGGNRHGFLAFAEIHPDYYQIPVAVREAIMKEEALDRQGRDHGDNPGETEGESKPSLEGRPDDADSQNEGSPHHEMTADRPGHPAASTGRRDAPDGYEYIRQPRSNVFEADKEVKNNPIALDAVLPAVVYEEFSAAVARAEEARDERPAHPDDVEAGGVEHASELPQEEEASALDAENALAAKGDRHSNGGESAQSAGDDGGVTSVPEPAAPASVEVIGSEDALEELPQRHKRRWRHYKIQEVIKRNQIVLIQVVKEERGTKGAALTTYLSLAGRYTVLMPNTPSGGGISRKITVPADRKRLKEIAQELEVPEGMGLIIRTAGASRTKAEIKRDFEYLLRLWENVRDLTLKSTAPFLVYEEGNLIKRSIRDLYNKDIDEILVSGDEAHREAKDFMRMLMPSHAKNVIQYKEPEPLFIKYEVERQLNQMFNPVVTLKSGGYIVLNQTEALVAIDVNSGRATREYSIEDTALKTNLEASEEVARQVRLRDLAGLIVIDFIDMDERRNNRAVERKIKEALRHDRARIQVGHISHFGLLEMSRQRLRQGVVEVSTMPCPVCQGVGHIRSTESVALMILRSIEDHLRTQGPADLTASASTESALYILNHKRAYLRDIEMRYGVTIVVQMDENIHGSHFTLARGASANAPVVAESRAVQMEPSLVASGGEEEEEEPAAEGEDKRTSRRKRRRRRGRGEPAPGLQNGSGSHLDAEAADADADGEDAAEDAADQEDALGAEVEEAPSGEPAEATTQDHPDGDPDGHSRRNRRRGRRGGRRHREEMGTGGGIPGLGEQPDIPHGLNFPRSVQLGPIESQPALGRFSEPASLLGNFEEPAAAAQATISEPARQEAEAEMPATRVDSSEKKTPEPAPAPTPEPALAKAVPAQIKAPEPARPKPLRTGPPRKGWWQGRIG